MLSTGSDLSRDSQKMMQDEKFSKLLSKESSVANPSFRVYYGVASGSVPFMWESQPGTPKHAMSSTSLLPPLTPPPSYFSTTRSKKSSSSKSTKSGLINSILPKLNRRTSSKNIQPPPPPPPQSSISFSSSSTSSSSSISPMSPHRRRPSSPRLSFSSMGGEDYDSDDGSPTSTLCFGMRQGSGGGVRGCYSMKNALMSIVGQGSSHGTAA